MTRALAAIALTLLAGGCAATRKPDQPSVLRVAPSFAAAPDLAAGSVALSPVQAEGTAAQRRYAYVDRAAPGEVKQAASLFWEEPPPRLAEHALIGALRARFRLVVAPGQAALADRRVAATVSRFEEESGGGQAASARVWVDVTALDAKGAPSLSGRYCAQAPIAGERPSDRAAAFEIALGGVASQIAKDLASPPARPPSC